MLKAIKVTLIIGSLLISVTSWAFWSIQVASHRHITSEGLSKYKFKLTNNHFKSIAPFSSFTLFPSDPSERSFTPPARTYIGAANHNVDEAEDKVDDDRFHCDNEQISDCAQNVRTYKSYIIKALNTAISESKIGSYDRTNFDLLRTKLGESLHILQDFYSHSNWVERHIYGTQGEIRLDKNFKKNTLITDINVPVNTDFFLKDNYFPTLSDDSTCVTGPAWNNDDTDLYNDLSLEYLTTGYYKRSNNIYVAKTYPVSVLNSDTHKYCNIPSLVSGENYCLINGVKFPLGYATNIIVSKIPGLDPSVEIPALDSPVQGFLPAGGYSIKTGEVSKQYDGPFFQKNTQQFPTGIEKCIHSGSIRTHKPAHIGIAKDHRLGLHHKPAFDVAARATTIYVKALIDEVIKQNGEGIYTDWAILNFLGYDVKIPNNLNKPNVINISPYPDAITNNDSVEITMSKGQSTEIIVTFDKAIETASFVNESSSGVSMTKIDAKNWKHTIKYDEEGYYFVKINSSSKYASNSYDFKIIVIDNPLETPENLSATRTNANNVNLTWDTVEGADGYNVYIFKNGKNSTGTGIEEIQTTETSLPLVLDKTKTFFVVIEAYNEVKTSDVSDFLEIPETLAPLTLSIPNSLSREEGKNKFVPFTFSPLALKDTVDSVTCSTNPNIGALLGTPSKQGVSFIAPQANAIPSFTLNCEALSLDGSVLSTSNNLVVTVTQTVLINNPPVASINGTDSDVRLQITVDEGASVNLDANSSSDPDSDTLTYKWLEAGLILNETKAFSKIFALGVHTVTLQVNDGKVTSEAKARIEVKEKPNTLPVARITSDTDLTNVFEDDSVTLKGDTSTDAEGAIKSYLWEELGQSIGTDSTVSLPNLTIGKHFIKLTVTDSQDATNSLQIIIDAKEKLSVDLISQYTYNNAHTYYIYNEQLSWADSKSFCDAKNLHLATITSSGESAFIDTFASDLTQDQYWIGGTDENNEGDWEWITGEEWSYENWHLPYEPNNKGSAGEDYLTLVVRDGSIKWNDLNPNQSGYSSGFICEGNLNSGLVAHYEFENNANDSSGNAYHGTEFGGVSYVEGVIGNAASFDGVDDRISISNEILSNRDIFSVSFWVKTNKANEAIISGANDIYDNEFLIYADSGSFLQFYYHANINSTIWYNSNIQISDSEYKNIVIIFSSDETVIYTDGQFTQKLNDGFSSSIQIDNNGLWIGMEQDSVGSTGSESTQYFLGQIDDLRIYNRALLNDEITALYQLENITTATEKLNDTGITQCADNSSNNLACPVSTHPNQDAQSGRDVTHNDDSDGHAGFSFTKISSTGAELPASATEWSCVKDNVTGLMWEVKTDDGGLHDKDNTYTWYNPDPNTNGGYSGTESGSFDTDSFVSNVNNIGYCGANDWRMPIIEELRSIVDYSLFDSGPMIDVAYFPNTVEYSYWSSVPAASLYNGIYKQAWEVSFSDGFNSSYDKSDYDNVRLVRSGQ